MFKVNFHIYRLITAILLSASAFGYAQEVSPSTELESEGAEMHRQTSFDDMRRFADGTLPDTWSIFQKYKREHQAKGPVASANWQSLGPNTMDSLGGRMTCHSFHPTIEGTILAGAAGGGLWKTINGGDDWFPLTDDLPSLRISAVAYNPLDPEHILLGTGHFQASSFTLVPGIGLLESFDGGETWLPNELAFDLSEGISITRILFGENGNVFVGSSSGVWVSNDSAETWSNTLSGVISDLEMIATDSEVLYAGIHSNGIYKSTDAAQGWTQLTNGLPPSSSTHRINIALSDSFPDFALASIVSPIDSDLEGLYKTSNGGASWIAMENVPAYLCNPGGGCLGWFVNMIAVSPIDTNVIVAGGTRLYRTIDGGESWASRDYLSTPPGQNVGVAYVDQQDAGFDPFNPNTIYVFDDGGVFRSNDNGFFWEKKNLGLVTTQFYRIASFPGDSALIIGGVQDAGLQYLDNTDNNQFWRQWHIGDGCALAFDPNNPNKAYGDNLFAFHYRTNNVSGGNTQTANFNTGITGATSTPFLFVTTHHPTLSNVLYTANDNFIFKSTNGTSWSSIANIPNVRTIEVSKFDPSIVYANAYTGSSWTFHVSFDDGENWQQTSNSPGWRVTDVESDPNTSGVLYATRNSILSGVSHVFKSTDDGNTWSDINEGLPDIPTWCITVNPYDSEVLYVGTDLGVFISENGGESWEDYNDNLPPYYVMDMHYHMMDSTLRVATLGRGVWKTKSIPSITTEIEEDLLEDASFIVFPNPFDSETRITFALKNEGYVHLSVLNELGQECMLLQSGYLTRGEHSFRWNGYSTRNQALPSGIYFIRLQINDRKLTKKVVLH